MRLPVTKKKQTNKTKLIHDIMKTTATSLKLAAIAICFLVSFNTGYAQSKGSGNIVKQDRTLPAFTAIEVGSAFYVKLSQGNPAMVTIETDDNYIDKVKTEVNNDRLEITTSGLNNPSALKVYITVPDLKDIEISGAAKIESTGNLNFSNLNLDASGASKATIEIESQLLKSDISGAARAVLSGKATEHITNVSGAAKLDAYKLSTITTTADVSGAAKAQVYASSNLNAEVSGAGALLYIDNSQIKRITKTGNYNLQLDNPEEVDTEQLKGMVIPSEAGDSTLVNIGDLRVEVV